MGGVMQGVGQALSEHGYYNSDGQLVAGNLLEYAIPRAARMPRIENGRTETPSPHNPLGAKGCGVRGLRPRDGGMTTRKMPVTIT